MGVARGLGSQGHEVTAKLLQRLPQRRPPLPPSAMFMKETGCNPIRWDQRRWHQESRDRSGASGMASSSLLITDQRCIGETWRLEAGRPCAMRGFQADLALMADIACAGPHLLLVNFFPIYKLGPHQHLRHFSCWSLALLSFISSLSIEGVGTSNLLLANCRHPKTAEDFLKLSPGRKSTRAYCNFGAVLQWHGNNVPASLSHGSAQPTRRSGHMLSV
uniref:Uncharacterized protein n=1 Tax=Oryza rufipogon TaxID=4529 RepID=A0A0E0RJB7_ORYRU